MPKILRRPRASDPTDSTNLCENARLLESTSVGAGRKLVQLISPGWGSSGYYSTTVLENAAADVVIPAGTHMYADHPTDVEAMERPGRSIKDLISVTTEDARLATAADVAIGADAGALVAEVRVAAPYRDLINDLAEDIGVSIRGDATDVTVGEAEGRSGRIIEGLAHVQSVDWVTAAGRGGKVLSVLESARTNHRAIGRGLAESTVNDTREALSAALRDAHGGDKTWVWVRDFDDDQVWFEIESEGDDNGLFAQAYTQNGGGAVALTGERTEVRVVTTYVPATRPDGSTTEESKEDTMGKIQIEESEHTALSEKAGRVDALVTENASLKAKNTELEEAAAKSARLDRARVLVTERATTADVAFTPLEIKGLVVDLPLKEGALDEETFTKDVDEAAAAKKAAGGAGSIHGFGGAPAGGAQIAESDIDKAVGSTFGRTVKEA